MTASRHEDASPGSWGFLDAQREIVASFDASSDDCAFGLDTPDDIGRLERRTGRAVRAPGGTTTMQGTRPTAAGARGDQ